MNVRISGGDSSILSLSGSNEFSVIELLILWLVENPKLDEKLDLSDFWNNLTKGFFFLVFWLFFDSTADG